MKIIATDITNLTDARYFAAMGVDFLGYNVDPDSDTYMPIETLKEISEWVEGPKTILTVNGLGLPDNFQSAVETLNIDQVILSPFVEQNNLPSNINSYFRVCDTEHGGEEATNVIMASHKSVKELEHLEKARIKQFALTKSLFWDGRYEATDLREIEQLGFIGIVVRGSDEEKVGYKSYEELDQLFDSINE